MESMQHTYKGQVYNHHNYHRHITSLIYWKGITHNIKTTIAVMTGIIDIVHQPPTQMFIWQLKSTNKRKDNLIYIVINL